MIAMSIRLISNSELGLLSRCLSIFPKRDRSLGIAVVCSNIFLGILDVLGVLAIGVVGSLAVSGVSTGKPNGDIARLLSNFGLMNSSFQTQVAVLTISACILFISRTLLSMFISRRILHFLSRRAALISGALLEKLLIQPLYKIQERSSNQILYILDNGVSAITLGIIGSSLLLLSDFVLLIVMFVGLLTINVTVALTSFFSFTLIGLSIFALTHKRAKRIGNENASLSIISREYTLELLDNYREILVKFQIKSYEDKILDSRKKLASATAEIQFLPTIGKYIIESSVILLGLTVSALQFLIYDAVTAVSALAIFLAAGSRLAPLIMRMQQSALQIKSSSGMATPALELIDQLQGINIKYRNHDTKSSSNKSLPIRDPQIFIPRITMKDVEFSYEKNSNWKLRVQNLVIPDGLQVAIVGPSGGGKSTLVDLILGILEPNAGEIAISGESPRNAIRKWPGAIGYVPQTVNASRGTIRSNIARGVEDNFVDEDRINILLEIAKLEKYKSDHLNEDLTVTDGGSNLSGGERQRLGIARALYSSPKLLVLDEATSALDAQTEEAISDAIENLKVQNTVILIAHRLSSVRKADLVIYVDSGEVIASGTIDEVRAKVPDFQHQAELMGL